MIQKSLNYQKIRQLTEYICEPLVHEDYVVQPIVDVSPPKWHLAHTTWFFENFVLVPHYSNYKVCNSDYSFLFNSYYETVGERVLRPNRGNLTRPGVEEVYRYREYVDKHMIQLIDDNLVAEVLDIIEMGLQHEQQHQELLVFDIKYILGTNPIFPTYRQLLPSSDIIHKIEPYSYVEIEAGLYTIGHQDEGFCFDNELGVHQVYINPCRIMDRLVTNGEYLSFMESRGYEKFQHWLAEGWDWVNQGKIRSPFHWHQVDGDWYQYELRGGLTKLNLSQPVTHVSYYEADAYARWKGKRLPTEFEWEAASQSDILNTKMESNLADKKQFGPLSQKDNSSQLLGDVWEWTSSSYGPYPNYKTAEGALGEYNGKFMINQMVLKGGSCATPSDHIRTTYRNFFHPHLRWLFSGIRLAESY